MLSFKRETRPRVAGRSAVCDSGNRLRQCDRKNPQALLFGELFEARANPRIDESQNPRHQIGSVLGTRGTQSKAPDRNARRHLYDREQRVNARQRLGSDRYAEYRQPSVRGDNPWQVCSKPRNRDDRANPTGLKLLDVALQFLGCSMRREHTRLMHDPQIVEHLTTCCNDCCCG